MATRYDKNEVERKALFLSMDIFTYPWLLIYPSKRKVWWHQVYFWIFGMNRPESERPDH